VLFTGLPRYTPSGAFIGYVGSGFNIHDRKLAESALQQSEARLRAIMEATPECIKMVADDGTILYMNKSGLSMLQVDTEEGVIGSACAFDVIAPEDKETWIKNHRRVCQGESLCWEFDIIGLRGRRKRMETNAVPLPNPDGGFIHLAVSRDVTVRKRQEEGLQRAFERERLTRRIIEFINQTFDINSLLNIVAGEIGKFFKADRCFIIRYQMEDQVLNFAVHGEYYRSKDLPVINMSDFSPEAIKALTRNLPIEMAMRLQRFNTQVEYVADLNHRLNEYEHLSVAEREQYFENFQHVLVDKYHTHAVLRVGIQYRNIPYGTITLHQCNQDRYWTDEEVDLLQDIATQVGIAFYQTELYHEAKETAVKEQYARQELQIYTQKLENSNRELAQFTTIASHDLQEPLRKIQVFSEMLKRDESISESGKDYLQRMNSAANRMQTLMDDLLTLSRINRKGKPFRPIQLGEILTTVLDDMQISIRETQAEICIEEPLVTVFADESQIRQLLQNLISNALKYRRENITPCIKIRSEYGEDHRSVRITVEDNGIGFRSEYKEQIFEPFRRLHGMEKYPGTGMGLTICKKIVERHGGCISVESEPGQGSKFSIILPSMRI
jgi:PAS domain S-box-containing protein